MNLRRVSVWSAFHQSIQSIQSGLQSGLQNGGIRTVVIYKVSGLVSRIFVVFSRTLGRFALIRKPNIDIEFIFLLPYSEHMIQNIS